VNVTFKANGKSVTKENVTLPHTYRCSYISEADELDLIIKELYGISQGYCWDSPAPSCSGDNITAGVDDNDIYFTLNKGFWGSATVTGTYFNTEPTIDATFPFNLEITSTPVTSISSVTLSPTAEVFQGEKLTLAPTVLPAEADYPTATWTSSNTSVATVDANGKVTAKSGGTTTITASYHNGTTATSDDKTVTCTVTVKAHVTGVTLAQTNALLLVGKTLTLTPTILPANATNKAVTWTSSNTTVATVSNKGVVTAKAAGTTTITVTTSDGSFKATCTVEVIEISEGTYIRLGSYNGEYVDWFAARSNSNGWVMLSKYVLKNMKFGSNSTYTGSNIYKWLDADANGTFEDELGLTTTERSLVKQVNLSSTNGDGTDRFIIPYRTGEQPNGSPYTKAPYIYDKSTICGAYWLREKRDETSPRVIRSSDATVEARYSGPTNSNGVRPMFYLDTDNLSGMTFTGSGTEDDPYVFVKRYSMDLDITPAAGATVTMTAKRNDETTFSGTMPQKFLESEFLDKIAGSTITLTVTPTNGYTFNNLTVTSGGAAVTVTGEGNTRTFTMPSADVTVKVDLNMATDGTGAYLIRSLNDWKLFCEQVAGGNTFSGETVKMTANVSGATTRTSNALANPFSGTFDGQGHTLNLNINVTTADATSAPFGYINGATIQNLVITGSETTAGMRPASIAGFAKNSTITNCKSTVALTSSRNADIDCGAIVARTESSSTVTLNGCLFTGSITYSNATGYEGGGMVGWTRAGTTATLTNCVFAPSAISITKYSGHYMFVGGKVRGTLTNCYYNDVAAASSLTKEGKQMCTISAGTDVTSLAISGEGTEYDVSGITAYAAGIKYGGVYYAGSGDELSLSLTHASAPAGYTFSQYTRDIKVGFAKGNLTRASSKWAFLANSWTYNTSPSVVDTEDGSQHFQWGTVFKEAESGESAVADGITTDLGAGWRGLSLAEWRYLLGYDGDNSGVQSPRRTVEWHYYAKIKGAGVGTGDERYLLIFPDDFKETDWTAAMGTAPTAFDGTDESSVAYTEANFTAMQNAGIAILPAAGYKQNDSWLNVGKYGGYRTNQATSSANAYRLMFTNNALNLRGTISKTTLKLSVRLANESANSGKLAGRFTVSSDGGTFSAQDETSATLVMPDANAVISATYTENKATLAESTDNSEWISDHNRDVYDITLTRTLQTGGWNTFTVPFNLDTPSGWTVKELTETEYDGTTLTLTFGDAENGIEAGKPYLVKVGDANVVNPTFDDVTIVNGTTETVTGYANFVPVMNPTWLTGSDKSVLFVTGGNTLTYPAADGNINGFRAYFQLTPGLAARSFVMNFGDEQTGIESLTPDPSPRGEGSIYSLDGRKVNGNVNVKKGVYVVNGKKVIIK
jgi:uncharacterized protein YjdB